MDFKQTKDAYKASFAQDKFNPLYSNRIHYTEPTDRIIVLRNVFGRFDSTAKLRPLQAGNGNENEFLGVQSLTPEEIKNEVYRVDKKTRIIVKEGFQFNLLDYTDRMNWNWAQYDPRIVATREEAMSTPEAMFYIEDAKGELERKLKKSDTLYEAETLVRSWSLSKRMDMARLLGFDMSLHMPEEVLEYLVDKARSSDAEANLILNLLKDEYQDDRLRMLRFIDAGIIELKNGTNHYYNQTRMGLDEETALQWMINPKNRDFVDGMKRQWNQMRRPNLSGADTEMPIRATSVEPRLIASTDSSDVSVGGGAAQTERTVTEAEFKELAPNTYERIFAKLNPSQRKFLFAKYTEEKLNELIEKELESMLDNDAATPQEVQQLQRETNVALGVEPQQAENQTYEDKTPDTDLKPNHIEELVDEDEDPAALPVNPDTNALAAPAPSDFDQQTNNSASIDDLPQMKPAGGAIPKRGGRKPGPVDLDNNHETGAQL